MKKYNTKQYVELFHLLFLDFLGRKLDKRFYILKGGCNLRFFMKSIRYSEDIDLDVHEIPKEKLTDAVDGILDSRPFAQILRVNGMTIKTWSAPKQTETTQRWKLLLNTADLSLPFNTKIEFSRRGINYKQLFEPIDPLLISTYSLTPVMSSHYIQQAAYQQKIEALVNRTATQARDIFDLHLLLCSGVDTELDGFRLRNRIDEAVSNAMSVTYDMFKGQVFSYLHPDYHFRYATESIWDEMVLRVVEALEGEK